MKLDILINAVYKLMKKRTGVSSKYIIECCPHKTLPGTNVLVSYDPFEE